MGGLWEDRQLREENANVQIYPLRVPPTLQTLLLSCCLPHTARGYLPTPDSAPSHEVINF